MKDLQRIRVGEGSQIGEARRLVSAVCRGLGFYEDRIGLVAIVATEMSTNLLKHAGGGELLVRSVRWPEAPGIEILSVDRGPGIPDPGECMRDGYSTAGSPGTGLGAIRRLSSLFDLYSAPGKGTVVLSRIWNAAPSASLPPRPMVVGAVCVPVEESMGGSYEPCGDAWAAHQAGNHTMLMMADGLGHGIDAAIAAAEAVRVFQCNVSLGPARIIEVMHPALRSTRGAAVAVLEAGYDSRIVRYAGVGNIVGQIVAAGKTRNMVSHNGTVGLEMRKTQEFTYPWPENGLLLLHSDGLATHWDLADYPGLQLRHPSLIAGVLYRDHCRGRDDASIVAAREGRAVQG